jgi:hypothetical protein
MQTEPANTLNYACLNVPGALTFLGDRQGVCDLVPALCSALAKDVPEIARLLEQGMASGAASRLHSLKGFVPVFCIAPLAEELTRVERLSRLGATDELIKAYSMLAPQLQCLGLEAAHYLEHAPAAA